MNIETKIEKYASIIKAFYVNSMNDNKKGKKIMQLPIKTVDNINVRVTLSFHPKMCDFQISLDGIYANDAIDDEIIHNAHFYIDNININFNEVSKHIFTTIPKLKMGIDGKLKLKEEIEMELLQYELLSGLENISLKCDECCVCQNITSCKTCCNHSLCYRCMTHIKCVEVIDDEDQHTEKPCPLCRTDITCLNY